MFSLRERREDGQVSLAVLLLSVVVLFVGVGLLIFGQATDSRGQAQKAADAAALGAAEEIQDQWIRTWVLNQVAPSDPDDSSSLVDWDAYGGVVGDRGYGAAVEFAAENANATVTEYSTVNTGLRSIEVSVETLSEETESVGTADELLGMDTPQSSASATAEVGLRPGVSCGRGDQQWDESDDDDDDSDDDDDDDGDDDGDDGGQEPELESWSLLCSGPGTGEVSVDFDDEGPVGGSIDASSFGSLFEVRLTN